MDSPIGFYNNSLLAKPNSNKKPKTSVKVVIMIDEAIAGSIPILFNINGILAPVKPAIIKLPVIAKKITKPSIKLASKK